MEINFRHEINGMKVITAVAQDAVSGEMNTADVMLENGQDDEIIPIADTPENLWGENWRDGLTEEQIARLESE